MFKEKLGDSIHDTIHRGFDPDKRIEDKGKSFDVESVREFDPDARVERKPDKDGFYTRLADRIKFTNLDKTEGGLRGSWTGKRGDSVFVPSYQFMKQKLEKYGLKGIEYKKGEPDFSKVAAATVKIENMTSDRLGTGKNFNQADLKLAEQFNKEKKNGKTNWTAGEIKEYREKHHLSWHERCDCKTMDLVPTTIHKYFRHSGGVSECKVRDGIKGGEFDE